MALAFLGSFGMQDTLSSANPQRRQSILYSCLPSSTQNWYLCRETVCPQLPQIWRYVTISTSSRSSSQSSTSSSSCSLQAPCRKSIFPQLMHLPRFAINAPFSRHIRSRSGKGVLTHSLHISVSKLVDRLQSRKNLFVLSAVGRGKVTDTDSDSFKSCF